MGPSLSPCSGQAISQDWDNSGQRVMVGPRVLGDDVGGSHDDEAGSFLFSCLSVSQGCSSQFPLHPHSLFVRTPNGRDACPLVVLSTN